MRASTPEQASKEGKRFGSLLLAIFQKNESAAFEQVSDLAQYLAIDVLGYRDAEIANAWIRTFIAALMRTPTTEELSDQYAGGSISLEQFQRLIRQAIQAPPRSPTPEG